MYHVVVVPDASTLHPGRIRPLLDPEGVLYVVARAPGDMQQALEVAGSAGYGPLASGGGGSWWPAFLCHNVTKGSAGGKGVSKDVHARVSKGQSGLVTNTLSCHWQVLCFTPPLDGTKQPSPWKPKSHQIVTVYGRDNPDLQPLLDAIADHIALPIGAKRALVLPTGQPPDQPVSEYDTVVPAGADEEDNNYTVVAPARRFNLSSARKGRMLKAYLTMGSTDQATLKRDLDALESYFAQRDDYDPARKIISLVPAKDEDDFVTSKNIILGQVRAQLKMLRRRAKANSPTQPPSKRRRGGNGTGNTKGISAKTPVTQALRDFLVEHCGIEAFEASEGIPRTFVVRAIPQYIKANGLATGRDVNPDDALRKLLPTPDFAENITYFSIFKYINHNFKPKKDQSSETST
jgi:hypothetical protein